MFLWSKEEVYIGYSLEELEKVKETLYKEGIEFTNKVINHSDQSAGRGRSGSFGLNMDYERQYVVSVKRNDYEKAKYLVHSVLHA